MGSDSLSALGDGRVNELVDSFYEHQHLSIAERQIGARQANGARLQ